MKKTLLLLVVAVVVSVNARESDFISAYDADRYDDAAKYIGDLDLSSREVARRLGVMYYDGRGVQVDTEKGKALLESAMKAGDANSAINLAKIYYKIEKNVPKAAWCLMVAEGYNDASVKDDVEKLRGCLGDGYIKGVTSYISQLKDSLATEQDALKNKVEDFSRERELLTTQITNIQDRSKKKDEEFAREREELTAKNSQLGNKLATAEEALETDRKKIDELTSNVAAATDAKTKIGAEKDDLEKKLKALESSRAEELEREKQKSRDSSDKLVEVATAKADADKKIEELMGVIKKAGDRDAELVKLKKALQDKSSEAKSTADQLAELNQKLNEATNRYNALAEDSANAKTASDDKLATSKRLLDDAEWKLLEIGAKYAKLKEKLEQDKYKDEYVCRSESSDVLSETQESESGSSSDYNSYYNIPYSQDTGCGFGRGWNTFFCSFCNFFRVVPTTCKVYEGTANETSGFFGVVVAVVSAPVVLCCEAVPTVCDVGNGVLDMVTIGAYGEWLYSDSLTSVWYGRCNTHFPWIDRK